jgi:hypothetical protein
MSPPGLVPAFFSGRLRFKWKIHGKPIFCEAESRIRISASGKETAWETGITGNGTLTASKQPG